MIHYLTNVVLLFAYTRTQGQRINGRRSTYPELIDWILWNLEELEEIASSTSDERLRAPLLLPSTPSGQHTSVIILQFFFNIFLIFCHEFYFY